MILTENIEYQDISKVHFVNLLDNLLELNNKEKVRIINLLSSELNLKPLKEVAKEQNKSYNGLKKFGNPIIISGKYFGISDVKDNNLPF